MRFSTLFSLFFFILLPIKQGVADDSLLCLKETARQEKRNRIQTNLLSAISLVESGRFSKKYPSGISWPWTVMAEGKGRFYSSKKEAIKAVEALQEKGVKNIDVGCMQINLSFHPDAFESLDEAFTPKKNIAYAAEFLKRNYQETKSWGEAATRYHSKNVHRAFKYEDKLLETWNRLTKYGNPATPENKASLKDVSGETLKEINKDISKIKRKTVKRQIKKIKPGSPESKQKAMLWRKAKLEEYMAKKKDKPQSDPIFEEAEKPDTTEKSEKTESQNTAQQ